MRIQGEGHTQPVPPLNLDVICVSDAWKSFLRASVFQIFPGGGPGPHVVAPAEGFALRMVPPYFANLDFYSDWRGACGGGSFCKPSGAWGHLDLEWMTLLCAS